LQSQDIDSTLAAGLDLLQLNGQVIRAAGHDLARDLSRRYLACEATPSLPQTLRRGRDFFVIADRNGGGTYSICRAFDLITFTEVGLATLHRISPVNPRASWRWGTNGPRTWDDRLAFVLIQTSLIPDPRIPIPLSFTDGLHSLRTPTPRVYTAALRELTLPQKRIDRIQRYTREALV
jgi:hypothetical protein